MKILRAPHVVPICQPPIADGMVRIEGERITAVGPYDPAQAQGAPVLDLGAQGYEVLMPGLINAHCHLDYTMMRGAIPPQDSFVGWIREINALKRRHTPEDYRAAIADGFAELRRWGTTSVCNLAAFPELLPTLPPDPIRTWWVPELIDIRTPGEATRLVEAALDALRARPGPSGGLSPHAPYTASPALYRAARKAVEEAAAERPGMILTTHLAESADEEAMFRHHTGEFARFLASVGRPMDDCGHGRSSFGEAVRRGRVGPGWLLVHANGLDEADLRLVAESGPWIFVHCPCSHAWFGHPPFPWRQLEAAGATILLGTDSLASNQTLNLFEELRMAQKTFPGLTSEALLRTVTSEPAAALGHRGELGVLAPGAFADLIALPPLPSTHEPVHAPAHAHAPDPAHILYQRIIANPHPDPWMMIDGKPLPAR